MITKAVIPAAGLGTRFLPATKVQPKEMLPIVDTPIIHFVVEEAIRSGIDDILVITGRGKRTIEDYFDVTPELEYHLSKNGKHDLLDDIQRISAMADIHYIRQKEPKGLGDAVLKAEKHVGDEPFAVLLGDDVIKSAIPCVQQLINRFDRYAKPIIAVERIPKAKISDYGVMQGVRIGPSLYRVHDLYEKPSDFETQSPKGVVGRYVLTPAIFDSLKETVPGQSNELQLTDAINRLAKTDEVYAHLIEGVRYDAGDKVGYVKAIIDFALDNPELKREIMPHITRKCEK